MSLLEERYRRVLRLLPASYRAEREEEMVAAFLEAAGDTGDDDEAYGPSRAEIASVVALAVKVRLGGHGASSRAAAWGDSVRRAARLGLLIQAGVGCVALGAAVRLHGLVGAPPVPGTGYEALVGSAGSAERVRSLMPSAFAVLWIAAFVALLYGRTSSSRVLSVLAALPTLLGPAADIAMLAAGSPLHAAQARQALPAHSAYAALAAVTVIALLTAYHRDTPAGRRPATPPVVLLTAGGLAAAAAGVVTAEPEVSPLIRPWIDPGGVCCLVLLIAGLGHAAAHRPGRAHRDLAWSPALAILLVPLFATRVATILAYAAQSDAALSIALLSAQAAAVAVAAAFFLVQGTRELHRLPDAPGT